MKKKWSNVFHKEAHFGTLWIHPYLLNTINIIVIIKWCMMVKVKVDDWDNKNIVIDSKTCKLHLHAENNIHIIFTLFTWLSKLLFQFFYTFILQWLLQYSIGLSISNNHINKFSIWIRWMVLGLCTISNETYCNKIWYTISDFPYVNARKVRDCIDCMLTFNIRCQHICFVLKSFIFCYRKSSMKIIFKTLSRKKKNCKKN